MKTGNGEMSGENYNGIKSDEVGGFGGLGFITAFWA